VCWGARAGKPGKITRHRYTHASLVAAAAAAPFEVVGGEGGGSGAVAMLALEGQGIA